MLNVKERIEEIVNEHGWDGDYVNDIRDYNRGYICDIITEIADNNVDIYTYDLFEWAKCNYDLIEEANKEFGTNEDILVQIRQGQYLAYERELYDNIEDLIELGILDNLEEEEISDKVYERIQDIASEKDNNAQLEDYIDEIQQMIEEEKEEI